MTNQSEANGKYNFGPKLLCRGRTEVWSGFVCLLSSVAGSSDNCYLISVSVGVCVIDASTSLPLSPSVGLHRHLYHWMTFAVAIVTFINALRTPEGGIDVVKAVPIIFAVRKRKKERPNTDNTASH